MALAAALASWDEPCTSTFAAWRAELATVSSREIMSVQLILGWSVGKKDYIS